MGATPKIPTVTAELPPWRFPTFLRFLVLRSALCVASSPLTPATDRPHSDLRSSSPQEVVCFLPLFLSHFG